MLEVETELLGGFGGLLGIVLGVGDFVVSDGIGEWGFHGVSGLCLGFDRDGIIPLRGEIDLRRRGGFSDCRGRVLALVVLLIGDDGEFRFLGGLRRSSWPGGWGGGGG